MTKQQRERWGRRRQDGFWHFVVLDGALRFGPLALVIVLVIGEWAGGKVRPASVTTHALIWMFVGLLWGIAVWQWQESRFAKAPPTPAPDLVN